MLGQELFVQLRANGLERLADLIATLRGRLSEVLQKLQVHGLCHELCAEGATVPVIDRQKSARLLLYGMASVHPRNLLSRTDKTACTTIETVKF